MRSCRWSFLACLSVRGRGVECLPGQQRGAEAARLIAELGLDQFRCAEDVELEGQLFSQGVQQEFSSAGHATTIIIPGTSHVYRDAQGDGYPLRVPVGKLGKAKTETDLLIDQIRTIANQRFMGDKPVAELSRAHMKRVEDALKILVAA